MDSATEASCCPAIPMSAIIAAQAKAIDLILTRLIVLDREFNPMRSLDWAMIQAGRDIAERIERGGDENRMDQADHRADPGGVGGAGTAGMGTDYRL